MELSAAAAQGRPTIGPPARSGEIRAGARQIAAVRVVAGGTAGGVFRKELEKFRARGGELEIYSGECGFWDDGWGFRLC